MSSVLGLDTSASWCSVALVQDSAVAVRRAEVGNGHSAALLPMVAEVLAEAGTTLQACDAIAFGAGPGSFTGLRVACAAAQGLAFGAGLSVVPVGTLDAIAQRVLRREAVDGLLLVAQDARMGEVYWALVDGTSTTVVGPALGAPAAIAAALRERPDDRPIVAGVGNAWRVHGDAMRGLVERVVPCEAADAVEIAWLGSREWAAGRAVPPELALPLYVRNDVARTTAERAAAAARTSAPRLAA